MVKNGDVANEKAEEAQADMGQAEAEMGQEVLQEQDAGEVVQKLFDDLHCYIRNGNWNGFSQCRNEEVCGSKNAAKTKSPKVMLELLTKREQSQESYSHQIGDLPDGRTLLHLLCRFRAPVPLLEKLIDIYWMAQRYQMKRQNRSSSNNSNNNNSKKKTAQGSKRKESIEEEDEQGILVNPDDTNVTMSMKYDQKDNNEDNNKRVHSSDDDGEEMDTTTVILTLFTMKTHRSKETLFNAIQSDHWYTIIDYLIDMDRMYSGGISFLQFSTERK